MGSKTASREFEPRTVRSGQYARFHYDLVCSQCGAEDWWESGKNMPDDVVRKKLGQRGWLLGRNRAHDLCPACVGVKPENRLAEVFKVKADGDPVPTPEEVAAERQVAREAKARETDAILARHFAKPEAPAPEPEPDPSPRISFTPLVEAMHELTGEIRDLRAGQDLVIELLSQLAGASEQQLAKQAQAIEAIARIAPVVARSGEATAVQIEMLARSLSQAQANGHDSHADQPTPAIARKPIARRLPSQRLKS